jgi:Secretion system C-terminal sorting domain/Immunoglobulin domain
MENKSQHFLLIIAFLSFPFLNHAQYYLDWAKKIGNNVNISPKAQTVDSRGNVYVAGDNPDFFINKFDSLGNVIWEKTTPNILHTVNALATDEDGNIYIAGKFFPSFDFDWSDAGEHIVTVSEQSIFIAKYDGDGNFLWVHHNEEPNLQLNELEIAENGDLILVGNFTNTANIALNGATQEVTANEAPGPDTYDIFIARYDQNGNLLHHINFGGQGNDLVRSLAFSPTGDIIAVGEIGTASFDTITLGTEQYILPAATIQGFLIEINTDWQITNSLIIEGQLTSVTGMDVDESGDIFVTGRFQDNCDINGSGNPGGELAGNFFNDLECFAAKYNDDFSMAWGFRVGGSSVQFSKKAVLSEQGFWISGESQGLLNQDLNFYHSDSTFTFHKVGDSGFGQIYLALLDKETGIPLEAQSYASDGGTTITGLDVGKNNALYFFGQFQGILTFDDDILPYNLSSFYLGTSEYIIDTYIARKTLTCQPIEIILQPDSPQSFCQPNFEYEFLAMGTGLRYQWYEEDIPMTDFINLVDGWYIVGTQSNLLEYHSPSGGGWNLTPYSLQIANACGDLFFSDTLQTTIFGNPSVLVDQPNNFAVIGETAKLSVRVLNDYPDPAFQWYKGQIPLVNGIHFSGVDTDTLTINNVVDVDEANYFCIVGSPNCSFDEVATTSTLLYLEVGVTSSKDIENNDPTFEIFPNPANDFFIIDFQKSKNSFETIQITDIYGKIVKQLFYESNQSFQFSINLENIPAGIYSINVYSKKSIQSKKLIIR